MDHFSLVPLEWNRLEWWAALSPVALLLLVHRVAKGGLSGTDRLLLAVAGGLFLFSLGPNLGGGVSNPIYMAAWHVVPGFWRVAKPEVFFFGSWLLLLAVAARSSLASHRLLYPMLLLAWIGLTRTHEAYPGFSEEISLNPALCAQSLSTDSTAP